MRTEKSGTRSEITERRLQTQLKLEQKNNALKDQNRSNQRQKQQRNLENTNMDFKKQAEFIKHKNGILKKHLKRCRKTKSSPAFQINVSSRFRILTWWAAIRCFEVPIHFRKIQAKLEGSGKQHVAMLDLICKYWMLQLVEVSSSSGSSNSGCCTK